MNAYESGNAAYFATPPVNLIYAFHASLTQITKQAPSLEERFRLHREASQRMKAAAAELGLKQLPVSDAVAANGMTALWFPEGIVAADLLPPLAKKDVVVAAGLHKDHKRECTLPSDVALDRRSDWSRVCSQVLPHRVRLRLRLRLSCLLSGAGSSVRVADSRADTWASLRLTRSAATWTRSSPPSRRASRRPKRPRTRKNTFRPRASLCV